MKLNKVFAALSTAGVMAFSSQALAETELPTIEIYGKANVSMQSSDDGDGSFTELKSNASRIGFKGGYDITDDVEVYYRAEFQVDMEGDNELFKHRNIYVGFRGWFGELYFGKNDSALKQSVGRIDIFNDLEADVAGLFAGENRVSNSVTFKSARVANFSFWGTYIAPGATDEDAQFSAALIYGDSKFKRGPIYAALSADSGVSSSMKRVSDSKSTYDVTRASVQADVGAGFILGGIYHMQEDTVSGQELDGFNASLRYVQEKYVIRAQYQQASFDQGGTNSGISLGADYNLNKQVKLYTFFSTFNLEQSDLGVAYDPNAAELEQSYFAIGTEYVF